MSEPPAFSGTCTFAFEHYGEAIMADDVISPDLYDVDLLAVFAETVEELSREPFFDLHETSRTSGTENKLMLFEMGDRFHFRSALIPFRRIWRDGEDTNFKTILNLVGRYERSMSAAIRSLKAEHRELEKERTSWPVKIELTGKELVDGWLYSVFIHTSLSRDPKKGDTHFDRHKFEGWVNTYGRAPLEYAFREVVRRAGFIYFRIQENVVAPLLQKWAVSGFKPTISIAPAFGTARRERMKDGTVVIRRSSSLYGADETLLQKFKGLLRRFNSLRGTFKAFQMSEEELLKTVVESPTMKEMIKTAGFELHLAEHFPRGKHKRYEEFIDSRTRKKCQVWIQDEGIVVADRNTVRCWERDFTKLKIVLGSPSNVDFSFHSQVERLWTELR